MEYVIDVCTIHQDGRTEKVPSHLGHGSLGEVQRILLDMALRARMAQAYRKVAITEMCTRVECVGNGNTIVYKAKRLD